jgi:hypothetical protein
MVSRVLTELLSSTSSAALQGGKKPKGEVKKPVKPKLSNRKPSNRKPSPRDSEPSSRPRGRHAGARSDTSDEDADSPTDAFSVR